MEMEIYVLKIGKRFIIPRMDGTFVLKPKIDNNGLFMSRSAAEQRKTYLERTEQYKGDIVIVQGSLYLKDE